MPSGEHATRSSSYLGDRHLHRLGHDHHPVRLAPVEPRGELALVNHRGGHAVRGLVRSVRDDLDEALVAPPVGGGGRGGGGTTRRNMKNEKNPPTNTQALA